MITTKRIEIEKKLPFDADYIEEQLNSMNLDVLRWAVVDINEKNFILETAVEE